MSVDRTRWIVGPAIAVGLILVCGQPSPGHAAQAEPPTIDQTVPPVTPPRLPPSQPTPPVRVTPPPGWTLVWQDEFDGTSLGPAWIAETGGGGWGNNEKQFYRAENARVEDGNLVIEARRESVGSREFTSARLKTQGRASWRYGRIEARIRVPRGQGIWPAFWSMGEDLPSAHWPAAGELDILEVIGREPRRVYGTVHGPGYSGAGGVGGSYDVPTGNVADAFRVFTVEWEPAAIRWYVDGVMFKSVTPADLPGRWVFDHPFFIILNVAVGGNWPGDPDASTVFPQTMLVDYVRVYQKVP
jgi:beta-glucanase (GH16 family)